MIELNDGNFDKEVIDGKKPFLVDFWAEWCGPCKMISPVVEEIDKEYEGKVNIGKVNVDQNQNTAMKFGIKSIPTLLIFKDGEIKDQIIGAVPREVIKERLGKALGI